MNHATYTSCSIIYINYIITSLPTRNRSSRNKQTSLHNTVSPSTSLRQRGLAQASPPLPRRGLKQEQESNAGSRLGETPLAWASCVLAQKTLWSLGRPLAQEALGDHSCRKPWASPCTSRLGESSSPGRDYQCLPLFAPAQRILTPNRDFQAVQTPIAVHHLKQSTHHSYTRHNTPHEEGLASLT